MAIPAIAAQMAIPVAAQLISKLCGPNAAAKPQVEQPPPTPPPEAAQQQQLLAQMTGKGLKINVYA